jgi:hypothetical protein
LVNDDAETLGVAAELLAAVDEPAAALDEL